MKTHYNRYKYLTSFKKELTLILPAQEAKVPALSQILTQAGLNANEFCEKFNKITKEFSLGTLLPVSVFYTPREKNFEITFRPLHLNLILQQYIQLMLSDTIEIPTKYQINILDLYKTLIIKSFVINEKDPKKLFRCILGTLKSYEYPVEINFNIQEVQLMLRKNIIQKKNINSIINYINIEKEYIKNLESTEEIEEEIQEINKIDFLLEKINEK